MLLAFLNKVEERISVRIVGGKGGRKRLLERGERGLKVVPVVTRCLRSGEAAQAIRRFADANARSDDGFEISDGAAFACRSLEEKARELNERSTEDIMQRLGLKDVPQERIWRTQTMAPSMPTGRLQPALA